MVWDKTKIAEGVLAPDLNNEIRDNWLALEAALTKEHLFSTGETPDSNQGHHRQGSAKCFYQATEPGTRINGDAFTSIDLGALWIKSNDKAIYILTATTPTWTLISTKIIETMVAASHIWAVTQTFQGIIYMNSSAPRLQLKDTDDTLPAGLFRIIADDSKLYIQLNTAANGSFSTKINVLTVAADGKITLSNGSQLTTSAAPSANAGLANKKYVDDNVGSANYTPTSYAGEQSVTFPNGLIMKHGTKSVSANSNGTVTFDSVFGTAMTADLTTVTDAARRWAATIISLSTTTLVLRNQDDNTRIIHWRAWGY